MLPLYETFNSLREIDFETYTCTIYRIIFILMIVYRTLICLDGEYKLQDVEQKGYFAAKEFKPRHLESWFVIRFQLADYVINQKVYKYCILSFLD